MFAALLLAIAPLAMPAVTPTPVALPGTCNPIPATSEVVDPPELQSVGGVLSVTLNLIGDPNPKNLTGVCWWYSGAGRHDPSQWTTPPTLHLRAGERLQLTLINSLVRPPGGEPLVISRSQSDDMDGMDGMAGQGRGENYTLMCGQPQLTPTPTPDALTGRIYGYHRSPWNDTNLHFHGLNVSPQQPSDDVVDVMLCPRKTPSDAPKSYAYVLDIPNDEPPGTYWYHPHAHGESERQVISQLTGVIIIDPLVDSIPQQMRNRIIVVRDLGAPGSLRPPARQNERAIRATSPSMAAIRSSYAANGLPELDFAAPPFRFGPPNPCPDSLRAPIPRFNTKELLINRVPLPPKANEVKDLPETTITAGVTEYWRFVNTSADTILDVEMLVNGRIVPIPVTSRDGVPLVVRNGAPTWQPVPMDLVRLSPASRMEFYMHANVPGTIVLRTRTIDSGCLGDLAYERDLLAVHVTASPRSGVKRQIVPRAVSPVRMRFSDLAQQSPSRHRYFVFTEYNRDDEPEPDLYITELSNPTAIEHPFASHGPPDVIVKDGTIEDWTILNYTQELHEFHIHQIHFLVLRGAGIEHGQGQLLDTVDVPYGHYRGPSGSSPFVPGAVTLRMDFRDPRIIGEFVYHCHILSHEDNGMMARIRVVP